MKINLVIEADTPEELREACRALADGRRPYEVATPSPYEVKFADDQNDTPCTLVTGEPDDPYGDGNGPVDPTFDVAEPQPDATPSDESGDPAFDAAGLPWDERIHAGSKALNADGTWRKRRGVDDETVATIEAELRRSGGAELAPDANVTESGVSTVTGVDMSTPQPEAVEPQPDATPEPTAAPTTEHTYTAQDVMKVIGSAMSSGSREPTYITELCQEAQIGQIVEIFSNTDALTAIVTKLRKDGVISDV